MTSSPDGWPARLKLPAGPRGV